MILSATLLHNAVDYEDQTPIPRSLPVPGLRSQLNRNFWLSWRSTEAPGGWEIADAWVNENLRQGLKPVACLDYPPPVWSDDLRQWREYCHMLAVRYLGRVKHWEIGNEFDSYPGFPDAAPEQTGRAWRVAHDMIRAVDPECIVIAGSIQSLGPTGHGLRYLGRALDAFGEGGPQAVSVHVYPGDYYAVSEIEARLREVRGVLIAHGAPKALLWVSEFGRTNFADMTAKEQGAWLRGCIREFQRADVDTALFYQLDDSNRAYGGYGFDDPARAGRSIWNAAVRATT